MDGIFITAGIICVVLAEATGMTGLFYVLASACTVIAIVSSSPQEVR
jgi:hypothetical protein